MDPVHGNVYLVDSFNEDFEEEYEESYEDWEFRMLVGYMPPDDRDSDDDWALFKSLTWEPDNDDD